MRTLSSILDNYSTPTNPSIETLRLRTREQFVSDETSGLKCWYFPFPDAITSLNHLSTSSHDQTFPGEERKRVKVWHRKTPDCLWKNSENLPAIVSLDDKHFFIPALLKINSQEAIIIWVKVSRTNAAKLFDEQHHTQLAGASCWAMVANLISHQSKHLGLFSCAKILKKRKEPFPTITAIDDSFTQYPGLKQLIEIKQDIGKSHAVELNPIVEANSNRLTDDVVEFEETIFDKNFDNAAKIIDENSTNWNYNARAQYTLGVYYSMQKQHSKAASAFHRAQLLAHPDALQAEWESLSRHSKSFREEFKEAFDEINRGERLRALTTFRYAAQSNPITGNAILAYCLRSANEPEEGLEACNKTLSLLPNQSDVLGHKWSYLTALHRDEDALETAIDHLTRYPQDLTSIVNLKDSMRILNKPDQAVLLCERYDIDSPNIEISLKHFFDVYEQLGKWEVLREIFEQRIQFLRSPTVDTREKYAEILIETGDFERATQVLEETLGIEPSNASVILGYARCLARIGKEDEAEALLSTVLQDETRIDGLVNKSFIVCTLAEIQRRTGRPELAIELLKEKLPEDLLELSEIVGPVPALEYAENLIALEKEQEAKDFINKLYSKWPNDEYVREIQNFIEEHVK